jgi:serine/threonine protein kinase
MCKAICDGQVNAHAAPRTKKDVHLKAARQLVSAVLYRLLSSTKSNVTTSSGAELGVVQSMPIEVVREVLWMASGSRACVVQKVQKLPTDCVSDVEVQVEVEAESDRALTVFSTPQSVSDPRVTNLAHFHCSTAFESLNSSNFTMVRKLSNGINGDIFKYKWAKGQDTEPVAVKKLRNCALRMIQSAEVDERCIHTSVRTCAPSRNSEDALTEIGVLSHLSKQPDLPLYLLKMLGVYSEQHHTWLLTEFADGGELFDVAAGGGLGEKKVQGYIWQILQGVDYLHRHQIGHRDISLENVLLKDEVVRLMDYGMAVRSHSSSGVPLRYFRQVGKDFYRAPECYVPTREEVSVTAPPSSSPGAIVMARSSPSFLCEVRLPQDVMPGTNCIAECWGYSVVPADVFAVGVCMFILAFQVPPWEMAKVTNRFFAHVYNCSSEEEGLKSLLRQWNKHHSVSPDAMHFLSEMLRVEPTKRPSTASCLNFPWFANMASTQVQLHADCPQN